MLLTPTLGNSFKYLLEYFKRSPTVIIPTHLRDSSGDLLRPIIPIGEFNSGLCSPNLNSKKLGSSSVRSFSINSFKVLSNTSLFFSPKKQSPDSVIFQESVKFP